MRCGDLSRLGLSWASSWVAISFSWLVLLPPVSTSLCAPHMIDFKVMVMSGTSYPKGRVKRTRKRKKKLQKKIVCEIYDLVVMILATTHDSATGPASQESGGHDSLDWAGRLVLSIPFSPNAYFQEAFFVMVLSFLVWRRYLSVDLIQVMFNPPLETGGNTLFTFCLLPLGCQIQDQPQLRKRSPSRFTSHESKVLRSCGFYILGPRGHRGYWEGKRKTRVPFGLLVHDIDFREELGLWERERKENGVLMRPR